MLLDSLNKSKHVHRFCDSVYKSQYCLNHLVWNSQRADSIWQSQAKPWPKSQLNQVSTFVIQTQSFLNRADRGSNPRV